MICSLYLVIRRVLGYTRPGSISKSGAVAVIVTANLVMAVAAFYVGRATAGREAEPAGDPSDFIATARQAVRDQLSGFSVLHFSCHGMAGFAQPLEGGLLLAHDERLTLREVLALRLRDARLALLSACETGVPGLELPDEVVSLPTGAA